MSLVLVGMAGAAFFWATDPTWGLSSPPPSELVDSMSHASPGTWIGIIGSAVICAIGLWLMTRRTA